MKKIIGTLVLSLLVSMSLFIPNQAPAQTGIGCDYWGKNYGCDMYDCGDCVFLACGSQGGLLICGFDDVISD
ncbi:hypothetical protein Belba_1846 [Belliella baltica DSM 15883]|uniref:Uncharacterized protein n=1 Tax=Belliella baltica (strain DSM 15883 / CIP 108006 / LMG 21964 / BA134) TaxID=866536 RepID=I3Z5B7_BELBD|nr:hypothetical protein [Belliella baltica]AFL84435.1 hypothetical protein Belba_1846 [Belliella baltica DSM 15883]